MEISHVDVTFDFDDQYLQEKEIFLDYLSGEKWIQNSEKIWRVELDQSLSVKDQLSVIKKYIENASKISKIKAVDYAIISDEAVYFNKID